jgi:hypothetical protein
MKRPNQRQSDAIRQLAVNGPLFGELVGWLRDSLAHEREGNDTRPLENIQVGQGRAQALNEEITILEDLVNPRLNK